MQDDITERLIQVKGRTAPRVTPTHIDFLLSQSKVAYHVFPGTTLTVCCLTLPNGYHVLGHSAAASPENFDREIGEKIALDHARDQVWHLEGYLLRDQLSKETA